LFSFILLLGLVIQTYVQTITVTRYPGVTDVNRAYAAAKVATPLTIDGDASDAAWAASEWAQVQLYNDKTNWGEDLTIFFPEKRILS
jgi:hypothetical protein